VGTPIVVCSVCELHAEAVFCVDGMDCSEEITILERRLKPLAGLEAVSADLIGQRLRAQYDAPVSSGGLECCEENCHGHLPGVRIRRD
jgi:hypothetical protein